MLLVYIIERQNLYILCCIHSGCLSLMRLANIKRSRIMIRNLALENTSTVDWQPSSVQLLGIASFSWVENSMSWWNKAKPSNTSSSLSVSLHCHHHLSDSLSSSTSSTYRLFYLYHVFRPNIFQSNIVTSVQKTIYTSSLSSTLSVFISSIRIGFIKLLRKIILYAVDVGMRYKTAVTSLV